MINLANLKDTMESTDKKDLVAAFIEILHRSIVHYGMWFGEAIHQYGMQKAVEMESNVFDHIFPIHMKRIAKNIGIKADDSGLPESILSLPKEQLVELIKAEGANWLAGDGVWFQEIERQFGMNSAKRINDTCWTQYSPFEAERIKLRLGLQERSGLSGLKQALTVRSYTMVNKQTVREESDSSFIFEMNECRVQNARKRRGLEDYPCKSGGLVEYDFFARTIDDRIKVECIGCPPDPHPDEWFCCWRFSI